MDGSPQRGSLHATTLWHSDAAEWAPSIAAMADIAPGPRHVRFPPKSGHSPMPLARRLAKCVAPREEVVTGAINRSGAYKISGAGLLVCGGRGGGQARNMVVSH